MKYIISAFILLFSMCEKNDNPEDDECLIGIADQTILCIEIYEPVCGCNNVTYANDCYAGAGNISSWTQGACKTN
jgi:hypothetical protein